MLPTPPLPPLASSPPPPPPPPPLASRPPPHVRGTAFKEDKKKVKGYDGKQAPDKDRKEVTPYHQTNHLASDELVMNDGAVGSFQSVS